MTQQIVEFVREHFEITCTLANKGFVILRKEPSLESVDFKVEGENSFVYNHDYIVLLIEDDITFSGVRNGTYVLTWKSEYCPDGDGLETIINCNKKGRLEVQYALKTEVPQIEIIIDDTDYEGFVRGYLPSSSSSSE